MKDAILRERAARSILHSGQIIRVKGDLQRRRRRPFLRSFEREVDERRKDREGNFHPRLANRTTVSELSCQILKQGRCCSTEWHVSSMQSAHCHCQSVSHPLRLTLQLSSREFPSAVQGQGRRYVEMRTNDISQNEVKLLSYDLGFRPHIILIHPA